jgi:hypothetical protein
VKAGADLGEQTVDLGLQGGGLDRGAVDRDEAAAAAEAGAAAAAFFAARGKLSLGRDEGP